MQPGATGSKRLQGKVAVVTGASRGIGRAVAQALAVEGCGLALTARGESPLDKVAQELCGRGAAVLAHACDITREGAVGDLFAAVTHRFGKVDVLVNNAGISHAVRHVAEFPIDDWRRTLDTNLTGMFLCTRAALALMSSGGIIINNLSIAARGVFAGQSAYCASKFGALGFTNTLREELRPRGIRVVALIAGATDTEMWNQFWPDAPRDRMMQPETVAAAVVSALTLPENAALEELVLAPTAGTL